MIVLDASAALDFLLRDEASFDWIEQRLRKGGQAAAPHLLDTEVAHVLRKHVLGRRLEEGRAAEALADLSMLPLDRYPARPLLPRIWELRHNLSAYDATYVALAEALGVVLITSERRLLELPAPASPARIESRHGTRTIRA
ncbi:MAG: type II toxin-antitoxin system VapC family toxin [Gaiellaceae bacterium]